MLARLVQVLWCSYTIMFGGLRREVHTRHRQTLHLKYVWLLCLFEAWCGSVSVRPGIRAFVKREGVM